jgi:hypothetical protein
MILHPLFRSVKIIDYGGELFLGVISKEKENMVWYMENESSFVI